MLELAPDVSAAKRRLAELQSSYLPPEWKLGDPFLERVVVGKLELFMAGFVASAAQDLNATGAAADAKGFPVDRAFFELVERISLQMARRGNDELVIRDAHGTVRQRRPIARVFPPDAGPDKLRRSLSNGVALHSSWSEACEAALCELVERDRVLRSFRGEFRPSPLVVHDAKLVRALRAHYTVEAYSFGTRRKRLRHTVAGLFLWPREANAPLVYGFGAGSDAETAVDSASRETLQRLAFLWGEELPARVPEPTPTPDYHQEHYLYPPHHEQLRAWLAGRGPAKRVTASNTFDGEAVTFVDLTPATLQGRLAVAKACSTSARVLRFGALASAPRARPHPIA